MRRVKIYCKEQLAGILIEENRRSYIFRYEDNYFRDIGTTAISLTLPKSQQEYRSEFIFPFFSNMIAEGVNLEIQSRYLKIDEQDVISLLLATGSADTIGAITVKSIDAL